MAIPSPISNEARRFPLSVGLVLIALHLLASCDFQEQESTSFRNFYDLNKDGELSRVEWWAYNHDQDIESGSFIMFEVADCDSNGRLTWAEYRDEFLRALPCKSESPYRRFENSSDPAPYLPLMLEAEVYDEIQRLNISWLKILETSTLKLPPNIYEMDLDGRDGGYVAVQCDQPTLQRTRIGLDPYNKDNIFNVSTCSLTNTYKRFSVSLALIEIELKAGTTFHIMKSLYIPPESTQQYRLVLPPGDSAEFEISVLNARGMWPSATPNPAE